MPLLLVLNNYPLKPCCGHNKPYTFLERRWGRTTLFLKHDWHIPPIHIHTLLWKLSKRYYINVTDQSTGHCVDGNILRNGKIVEHLRARSPGKRSAVNHMSFIEVKAQTQKESSAVSFNTLGPYPFWSSAVPTGS